jgi:MFS family permease
MKQTVPAPENRWEVLALFTASMLGASLIIMCTGTLMPFFEATLHISGTQLGFVLSAQMIGAVFTTSVAGMLTDRFGDKLIVFWSGLIMGTALILASLVQSYTWLLAWLVVYGIGYSAVTPAGSHAIIFFFKKADRGLAMGLRQCGVPLAGVLGSLVLPAVALRYNYGWALYAAGVVTIVTCVGASLFYREPAALQGEHASLRSMFHEMYEISRDVRLILITLTEMILLVAQIAMMAFLTLTLVHEAGYSVALAVTIFAVSQAAAIAGRLMWGWSSDAVFHGSRALPLAVICIITALAAFALASITTQSSAAVVACIALVLGFSAEGWLGVGVIAIAEIGGEEHSGSALGVALSWMWLAAFVAPALFGAMAQTSGYPFAWRTIAALALTGVVPALLASAAVRRAT